MKYRFYLLLAVLPFCLLLGSCGEKKPTLTAGAAEVKKHYDLANDYVLRDKLDSAETEYNMCIKADSNNWKAYYQLGGLYQMKGDFKHSLFCFSKAIAINPEFTLGYFNRSNLEDFMG